MVLHPARWLRRIIIGVVLLFVVIQFVPYGWWHENPPVTLDAPWPDAESRGDRTAVVLFVPQQRNGLAGVLVRRTDVVAGAT